MMCHKSLLVVDKDCGKMLFFSMYVGISIITFWISNTYILPLPERYYDCFSHVHDLVYKITLKLMRNNDALLL